MCGTEVVVAVVLLLCILSTIMPVIFGPGYPTGSFETSLRGQDSPRPNRNVLHKGCSGHLHGHGVKKERASRTPEFKFSKDCCHDHVDNSSSDEGTLVTSTPQPQQRRSQSSEYSRLITTPPVSSRRSTSASNSAVAQRLFSSPTKTFTAKLRAERTASDGVKMASDLQKAALNYSTSSLPRRMKRTNKSEEDSGNFSSSEENTELNIVDLVTPSVNKQNLIHGTSDDELSMEELRKKQRQQRRERTQQHRNGGSRRESPSPVKRGSCPQQEDSSPTTASAASNNSNNNNNRGRRSSDECSDSSFSPPASPTCRSSSNKLWPRHHLLTHNPKPRARSSGGTNTVPFAFGSSTKRFFDNEKSKLHKSPSDGVQLLNQQSTPNGFFKSNANNGLNSGIGGLAGFNNNVNVLSRTLSDPKSYQRQHHHSSREKAEIAKAWLKFKEDIESAMQKKPNSGYYKNLSDMMTTKMEMLSDEVRLLLPSSSSSSQTVVHSVL